jgi:hypothetical protein
VACTPMLIQNHPDSHLRSRRAFSVPSRTSSRFSAPTIVTSCAVWLNVVRLCLKRERSFNTLERDKTCDVRDPGLPGRLLGEPNNTMRNSMTVVRAGNPAEMVTRVECGLMPMRRRHRTLPLSFPSLAFLSWGPRLSPPRSRWALTPQESCSRSPQVRTSHHRGCSLRTRQHAQSTISGSGRALTPSWSAEGCAGCSSERPGMAQETERGHRARLTGGFP